MGMQIEKSFVVKAPAGAVWGFLTDPYKVASCLPGAAITAKLDEQTYGGTITVKVGPVTANYRGKMRFERLDAAAGEADISASGQETRGKGGADMRMKSRVRERNPGATEVTVTSDVNVMGVLAQFGRGMIQDVSDLLFQKFTEAMRGQLEATPSPTLSEPAPSPAPSAPAPAPASTPAQAPVAAPAASVSAASPPRVAEAIPAAPAPAVSAAQVATPEPLAPPRVEPLDIGAIGTAAAGRAALRTLRRPGFWIAAAVLVLLIYWFFR
jgi:carbon monoxide dehydrogenase subunit G